MELYYFEMNISDFMGNLGEQPFKMVLVDDDKSQILFMDCLPVDTKLSECIREWWDAK